MCSSFRRSILSSPLRPTYSTRRVDAPDIFWREKIMGSPDVLGCLRHHTPPRLHKATWACFPRKGSLSSTSAPGNQPSEPQSINKQRTCSYAAYYLLLFGTNLAIHRPAQSSLWHLFANRNYALLFFSRVLTEDSADHPYTFNFSAHG